MLKTSNSCGLSALSAIQTKENLQLKRKPFRVIRNSKNPPQNLPKNQIFPIKIKNIEEKSIHLHQK